MINKIWWKFNHAKAWMKYAMGLKLTTWEEFVIEIGLY